jgi:hypothetical protein
MLAGELSHRFSVHLTILQSIIISNVRWAHFWISARGALLTIPSLFSFDSMRKDEAHIIMETEPVNNPDVLIRRPMNRALISNSRFQMLIYHPLPITDMILRVGIPFFLSNLSFHCLGRGPHIQNGHRTKLDNACALDSTFLRP